MNTSPREKLHTACGFLQRGIKTFRKKGFAGVAAKVRGRIRRRKERARFDSYEDWIRANEPDEAELMRQRDREGRPFTFYHYMIDLSGGPCIYKRISGCGSGTEYMAVTPWGDLYPCHQFVGEEKFKLGDVWTGVTNTAIRDEFAACNVYARPECRDCWARLYCSGGCAANAYHATGKITGTYAYGCDLFRKRMECALMLAAVNQLEAGK